MQKGLTESKVNIEIVKSTLKEWLPDNWEMAYLEVKDKQAIIQALLEIMRCCMSDDDYLLFSLCVSANNDLIDYNIVEIQFHNYLDTHEVDDEIANLDILEIPISLFKIDYPKFISLTQNKFGWVYEHSLEGEKSSSIVIPGKDIDCDVYISRIAYDIHIRWGFIESFIIRRYNDSVKDEALAILCREWDNISVADYNRAIQMLRSVDAYHDLINTLRSGTYIKDQNGWKVKRSDIIEALRLEEEATRKDCNVTLKDWAELYEYDYGSDSKFDEAKLVILKSFYNRGSGLSALILGDLNFEDSVDSIKSEVFSDDLLKESIPHFLNSISEFFKESLSFYKVAASRGYAMGYRCQSLIYRIFGKNELADKLENEYKNAPYANKRAVFNLLRDYKSIDEYEERIELINNNFKDDGGKPCRKWITPLPLSLLALDIDEAKKYLHAIFDDIMPMLKLYIE